MRKTGVGWRSASERVEEEEEEEEERAKMLRPNDFFALQEGAEEETEPARERELIVE
jgi:hypothetical protein